MGIHDESIRCFDGNQTRFNVKITSSRLHDDKMNISHVHLPSKFFEGNLSIWTEDDVGVIVIFSSIFTCFLPSFLHCKSTKHDGLRGTSCGRPNYFSFLRSFPKIRNYRWSMRYLRSRINFKSIVLIDMQRLWMTDAAGYSSISTMFLFIFSMISLSASGGIHVWTKLLRNGIGIKRNKRWMSSLTMQGSAADCRQEHFRHEGVDMLPSMKSRPRAWCI